MTERIAETSPRFEASGLRTQIAGVIYLLIVLAAAFAEIFARGKLNVAGGIMVVLAITAVTLFFYDILSPLNRRLSLLAASFNLVGLAVRFFECSLGARTSPLCLTGSFAF